jgi:hypothetical protein
MLVPLKKPLVFEGLNLDDTVPTPDEMNDTIQPTFSVMTGRRGNRQFPLTVTNSSETGNVDCLNVTITGEAGTANVKDRDLWGQTDPVVGVGGYELRQMQADIDYIRGLLTTAYDGANQAFQVITV